MKRNTFDPDKAQLDIAISHGHHPHSVPIIFKIQKKKHSLWACSLYKDTVA